MPAARSSARDRDPIGLAIISPKSGQAWDLMDRIVMEFYDVMTFYDVSVTSYDVLLPLTDVGWVPR